MAKRSMFDQWSEFKKSHPHAVILFRVGTFFEILELDAYIIRKTLGFKMSTRKKGKGGYVPMVGFPPNALDAHAKKLKELGIGYVVVEQMEDMEQGANIRKRKIVDVTIPVNAVDLSRYRKAYESYLIRDFPLVLETYELNQSKKKEVTQGEKFIKQLRELNIDRMGGFDALKLLHDWQKQVTNDSLELVSND